jgi:pimeloyl-ACP methyl ester carboxylesterase
LSSVAPLHADEHGSGRSTVLLHGQPGGRRDWDAVVEHLDGRVRALVPDRPGYGATGGPAAGFADNAAAVVALLDQAGARDAVVVAHSWSGGVALELAERHADRVAALVLVGAIGGNGSVAWLDRFLASPVFGDALSLGGLTAIGVRPVRQLLAPSAADAAVGEAWGRRWRSFMTEQRAMLRELPGIASGLGEVRAPSIVVIGDADRIVRPSSQEALAEAIGAEIIRVPGAGHLVPRERPDAVADAIIRAAGLAPPGPAGAIIGA